MQPDRARLSRYWLAVAEQDLRLAKTHADSEPNAACFHAQQGAEKALKGVLVRIAGDIARTHVAAELLAEVAEAQVTAPDDVRHAAIALDRYYAGTRYPDALGDADPTASYFESDARAAIVQAQRVIGWARSAIETGGSNPSDNRGAD